MRRLSVTCVVVLLTVAVSALGGPAALASPKVLTLVEGPGARELEPGDGLSLFAYSPVPVVFQTTAGAVECPFNADTAYGILRGHVVTNKHNTDKVSIDGGLGTFGAKVACSSTIATLKGPVYVEALGLDWTLKLAVSGQASLKGSPKVAFNLYNTEAQQCYLERATVKGEFNEDLEAEFAGRLNLDRASSSAGCPTSAELGLNFLEAGASERLEPAHRIFALGPIPVGWRRGLRGAPS